MDAAGIIKPIFSKRIVKRRAARVAVVQCLYSIDVGNRSHSLKSVDEKVLDVVTLYSHLISEEGWPALDTKYLLRMVRFCMLHRKEIEEVISSLLSSDWKLHRLPKVVLCILIAGVGELFFNRDLDKKMIINEYLEVSKMFNHAGEAGFVNSLLDKVDIGVDFVRLDSVDSEL